MGKKNSRVVGQLTLAIDVTTALGEAAVPESIGGTFDGAFAQLRYVLTAYGPFTLGPSMKFVEGGVGLNVLDTSKKQNTAFDRIEFESFLRRAHEACARALAESGEPKERLNAGAEEFANEEGRPAKPAKEMFKSMAEHDDTSLIFTDGEVVDVGVVGPAKDEPVPDSEFRVAAVTRITRVKTTDGEYDLSLEDASGLRLGDRVHLEGVEPSTGAARIRAKRIDAVDDSNGELFDDSARAKPDGDPDDAK